MFNFSSSFFLAQELILRFWRKNRTVYENIVYNVYSLGKGCILCNRFYSPKNCLNGSNGKPNLCNTEMQASRRRFWGMHFEVYLPGICEISGRVSFTIWTKGSEALQGIATITSFSLCGQHKNSSHFGEHPEEFCQEEIHSSAEEVGGCETMSRFDLGMVDFKLRPSLVAPLFSRSAPRCYTSSSSWKCRIHFHIGINSKHALYVIS